MNRAALAWAFAALALLSAPAFAGDTVYYYSSDSIHSEVVVTDQNRNVVERTYYGPYGQVLNRDLRDGPGYTGHEEDPETGLVYMQQRYYDPEAGQFDSTDPVGVDPTSGGNFNRYAYASDNPYTYDDPFGEVATQASGRLADAGKSCHTGTHICGTSTGVLPLSIIQVGTPSVSESRNAAAQRTAMMGSSSSHSTLLASNSGTDNSVKRDETINAADAFAAEYTKLVESGLIGSHAASLLAEAGARSINGANKAYTIGMTFAGIARNTLMFGPMDIDFYISQDRSGPTGRYWPTSLINWGRLDWRPFDPGLNNSDRQIWVNFLKGAELYNKDH